MIVRLLCNNFKIYSTLTPFWGPVLRGRKGQDFFRWLRVQNYQKENLPLLQRKAAMDARAFSSLHFITIDQSWRNVGPNAEVELILIASKQQHKWAIHNRLMHNLVTAMKITILSAPIKRQNNARLMYKVLVIPWSPTLWTRFKKPHSDSNHGAWCCRWSTRTATQIELKNVRCITEHPAAQRDQYSLSFVLPRHSGANEL